MEDLPKGMTEEVMAAERCDGRWVGIGAAQADRAGRIRATDLSKLVASDGCRRALDILVKSSLASDVSISSGLTANNLLFAHGGGAIGSCLDEPDVAVLANPKRVRAGGAVVAPKKVSSVNPVYPESARLARESGIVILETHINANGCITSARILKPLTPLLNTSALLAVSQWRFTPGTLDGHPVDVIYNLTINFKLVM
jgi:TonB family protein